MRNISDPASNIVVWDGSAVCGGVTLNTFSFNAPHILNKLQAINQGCLPLPSFNPVTEEVLNAYNKVDSGQRSCIQNLTLKKNLLASKYT